MTSIRRTSTYPAANQRPGGPAGSSAPAAIITRPAIEVRVSRRKTTSSVSKRLSYKVVLAQDHHPTTMSPANTPAPVQLSSAASTSAQLATKNTKARS